MRDPDLRMRARGRLMNLLPTRLTFKETDDGIEIVGQQDHSDRLKVDKITDEMRSVEQSEGSSGSNPGR
ncbi:MAG TPA: hypothetical protein VI893_11170 [Thermoplasmata archaeon]|nr:hypothetical protein [Thermoplasmata archaeon]